MKSDDKFFKYKKLKDLEKKGITPAAYLCSYVRKKNCRDCGKITVKYNRCRDCHYHFKGWDLLNSSLEYKGKRESAITPAQT